MKGKLIFFDIDGTLWDWMRRIPDSTVEAMRRLHQNGHIPLLCSGRAKGNIRDRRLLDMGFDGMVAACGSYVEYKGQVLRSDLIEQELVKTIVETSRDTDVPIVLEGPGRHWISGAGFEKDDFVTMMYADLGADAVVLGDYTPSMVINKFSGDVITCSDYRTFKEKLEPYFTFIEHPITDDMNIRPDKDINSISMVFEAVIPGTGKSVGIRQICSCLGTDPADAFAFGDSNNDLDMIKCVGTGIAMGNSSDALKTLADYVTDNVLDDGIYHALEHFRLI